MNKNKKLAFWIVFWDLVLFLVVLAIVFGIFYYALKLAIPWFIPHFNQWLNLQNIYVKRFYEITFVYFYNLIKTFWFGYKFYIKISFWALASFYVIRLLHKLILFYFSPTAKILARLRLKNNLKEAGLDLEKKIKNLAQKIDLKRIPRIFVLDSREPNVFALGTKPRNFTLMVSQGASEILTDEELGAVILQKLYQIKNQDVIPKTYKASLDLLEYNFRAVLVKWFSLLFWLVEKWIFLVMIVLGYTTLFIGLWLLARQIVLVERLVVLNVEWGGIIIFVLRIFVASLVLATLHRLVKEIMDLVCFIFRKVNRASRIIYKNRFKDLEFKTDRQVAQETKKPKVVKKALYKIYNFYKENKIFQEYSSVGRLALVNPLLKLNSDKREATHPSLWERMKKLEGGKDCREM